MAAPLTQPPVIDTWQPMRATLASTHLHACSPFMCLIAFAWQPNAQWQWVLAANRDEFHARPSKALAPWPDAPQVLGGLDLSAGGSWLGVSETGRLAAVTNVRLATPPDFSLHSRGALVADFLRGQSSASEAAAALQTTLADYGPCNLLLADARAALYISNRNGSGARQLAMGVYALSNASLDTPWPKTLALKAAMQSWLARACDHDIEPLFTALADETQPADVALPDTGIGLLRERIVARSFIRGQDYGTRCSTVLMVDAAGRGLAVERRFGPAGAALGESRHKFHWHSSTP